MPLRALPGQRKGLAITSLVLGILSLPTLGLLGLGALLGVILGVVALVKADQEPSVYGGKPIALAGIVASVCSFLLIPFLGIIAAIAIPSLLRARVYANEATALRDIRAFQSAEEAYHSASGAYGRPECLVDPSTCIPGYKGSAFLAAEASSPTHAGYRREFEAGPSGPSAWAYVAVPITRNRTGVRAFCGDSTGRLCATQGTPSVIYGRCGDPCQDLP